MRELIAGGLAAVLGILILAASTITRGWTYVFAGDFAQFDAVTKETVEGSFATRTKLTWLFENPFRLLGNKCYVGSSSNPERADRHQIRPVSFNARTRLDICLA